MKAIKSISLFFAAALVSVPLSAFAQQFQATAIIVRGVIEKVGSDNIVVKTREGETVTLAIPQTPEISPILPRTLADVKAGSFIGSSAVPESGKFRLLEIHIFPDRLRGRVPELQSPWNLVPNSVNTTGIVQNISTSGAVTTVKLKSKDQEYEMIAAANTPIVTYGDPDRNLLKPGITIFTRAQKKEDGSWWSEAMAVEQNGVKPPM